MELRGLHGRVNDNVPKPTQNQFIRNYHSLKYAEKQLNIYSEND